MDATPEVQDTNASPSATATHPPQQHHRPVTHRLSNHNLRCRTSPAKAAHPPKPCEVRRRSPQPPPKPNPPRDRPLYKNHHSEAPAHCTNCCPVIEPASGP